MADIDLLGQPAPIEARPVSLLRHPGADSSERHHHTVERGEDLEQIGTVQVVFTITPEEAAISAYEIVHCNPGSMALASSDAVFNAPGIGRVVSSTACQNVATAWFRRFEPFGTDTPRTGFVWLRCYFPPGG